MSPGMLIKKVFIFSFLLFSFISLQGQFSYRHELSFTKDFVFETDHSSLDIGFLEIDEQSNRRGGGLSFNYSYNFEKLPVSLGLGFNRKNLTKYNTTSNIGISDYSQELKFNTLRFSSQYFFRPKSSFNSFIFIGLSYSKLNYQRLGIKCYYDRIEQNDYIQPVQTLVFYRRYQVEFGIAGIACGGGVKIKITDEIGAISSINFDYLHQNETNWLGKNLFIPSVRLGVLYRFSKRIHYNI